MTTPLVDPAYHIPLSDEDLKMIGEICAIQGQIEYLLQRCVKYFLDVSHDTMLTIMGSTSLRTNATNFVRVARDKCKEKPCQLQIAEGVFSRIEALSTGRNDFVHAIYAQSNGKGFGLTAGPTYSGPRPALENIVAVRTQNRKQRTVSDIATVRNEAARISRALAHLAHLLMAQEIDDGPTPWRDKFW